jgi:hypothetical protein
VDTATDTFRWANGVSGPNGGTQDVAVSADGSTVAINGYFADSNLNPENVPAYVDWETWLPQEVLGQKLSHDGSLLFQPLTDGVDILSRNTGRLLFRVQVPGGVNDVYDALLMTGDANTVGVITPTGVSFLDFSSLPLPAATPFPRSAFAPGIPQREQEITNADTKPQPHSSASRKGYGRPALRRHVPGPSRTAG